MKTHEHARQHSFHCPEAQKLSARQPVQPQQMDALSAAYRTEVAEGPRPPFVGLRIDVSVDKISFSQTTQFAMVS